MPGFLGATVGTTTQRGYGRTHQRARKEAFEALPEWSPCARCSKPMWKHSEDSRGRSSLHYDHAEDGTYLGFSHGSCNRVAGAAKGGRVAISRRKPSRFVRDCVTCGNRFRAWTEEQTRCSHKCRVPPRPKKPAEQLKLPLGKPRRPQPVCACGQPRNPAATRCADCYLNRREFERRRSVIEPLARCGMTNAAIAARTGLPIGTVGRIAKSFRLQMVTGRAPCA
jgi:hypothetical protein